MEFIVLLILGSLVVSGTILLTPPGLGEHRRPWLLRTSWAMWTLQPTLFLSSLLIGLTWMDRYGYTSSDHPDYVDTWLNVGMLVPVGIMLLVGTVTGGLAWRKYRHDHERPGRQWWALAATLANALWFGVGIWLFGSTPVGIVADVVIVALTAWLLLWPRHAAVTVPDTPETAITADDHLVT